MPYRVKHAKQVQNDLDEIFDYIAFECVNPHGAYKVIGEITTALETLSEDYGIYPINVMSPLYELKIHTFCVGKYRIFYQVKHSQQLVYVLRVIHVARDLRKMAMPVLSDV